MSSLAVTVGIALLAYLMGGLDAGYYLVRYRTGSDIRDQGSGGTGARNAGRVLGRSGFLAVMFLDCIKGALAVLAATWLAAGTAAMAIAAFAAVVGHIAPIQLQFKGGKGASTALGALLVLVPKVAIMSLVISVVLYGISRKPVASGVATFMLMPAFGWAFGYSSWQMAGLVGVTVLLVVSHRSHLPAVVRMFRRTVPAVGEPTA